MEIALQNGSVWLGPCSSTHKTTGLGENKQPLISCESRLPNPSPTPSLGKAANMGHQLLSAGNPLWSCLRSRRMLEKAGGYKKRRGGGEPHTRSQDRRGGSDWQKQASSLNLSMLLSQKMKGVGGKLQQTLPLFMQHVGNSSNGNFSCSFTFSEFCWW